MAVIPAHIMRSVGGTLSARGAENRDGDTVVFSILSDKWTKYSDPTCNAPLKRDPNGEPMYVMKGIMSYIFA